MHPKCRLRLALESSDEHYVHPEMRVDHRSIHAVLYKNVLDLISSFGVFRRALSAPKVMFAFTSEVFG